jgi:hypothetical protein
VTINFSRRTLLHGINQLFLSIGTRAMIWHDILVSDESIETSIAWIALIIMNPVTMQIKVCMAIYTYALESNPISCNNISSHF